DDRVVERRLHVRDAAAHVAAGFAFLALGHIWLVAIKTCRWRRSARESFRDRSAPSGRCYRISFTPFLPATVLRGPFRVRALVLVRWPRTGRPRRWRRPR